MPWKLTSSPIDPLAMEPGKSTALYKLHTLKQGADVNEYINMFKQLCEKAGITNFATKKYYFLRSLKPGVFRKICDSGDILDTFDRLIKRVVNIESAYQLLMSHRSHHTLQNSQKPTPRYTLNRSHDPNAMDVDRMTDEARNEHMKKGLCFKCHKSGHRANNTAFHPHTTGDARKNDKGKKPVRCTTPDDEQTSKVKDLDDDEDLESKRLDF
ncbi:hypothetical protein EV424DRAFT_1532448 [Suillus variegatus]|nr:hypothetical protein EV424DRAFT_1532448 [Suillus variegatus]